MAITKIHLIPLGLFVLILSSFIITYTIAVCNHDVDIGFPYISDTGTKVPESCIFSQLVNLIAFYLAIFMYVRYKQVEQHYRDHLSSDSSIVMKINRWSLLIGWIGCFAVTIVGNFQVTSIFVVHMSGAIVALGSATLYCWIHTVISYYVCPLLNSLLIARSRIFLSIIMTFAFTITLVGGIISHIEFHGKDFIKWKPEDGGFTAHIISTVAEWLCVIAFDFYILTFTKEMHCLSLSSPQVHFIVEDLNLQSTEFYNSEDHVNIITSQSGTHINSLSNSPHMEFGKENVLTTQAIVH